jgi:hypothetical protein
VSFKSPLRALPGYRTSREAALGLVGGLLPYTIDFSTLPNGALPPPWTGTTWTINGGTAVNTPTLGAELVVNGNFANWTADNPDNWTVIGEVGADPEVSQVGTGEGHGGVGVGMCNLYSSATGNQPQIQQNILPANSWVRGSIVVDTVVAGSINIVNAAGGLFNPQLGVTASRTWVTPNSTASFLRISTGGAPPTDITIDDASLRQFTLSTLFAYMDAGRNDVIVRGAWTIGANYQAGVVALSDGTLNNSLAAVYNRAQGTAVLFQHVGGTITRLINSATAYAAGANVEIRVSGSGAVAKLYYNGAQVGANQSPNAAIQGNTQAGMFSTNITSTLSTFSVVEN